MPGSGTSRHSSRMASMGTRSETAMAGLNVNGLIYDYDYVILSLRISAGLELHSLSSS